MSWFLILSILVSQAWSAPFDFLAEVEDVEKEMWWIITAKRIHSSATPYRSLQKALNEFETQKKSPVKISTCSRMSVEKVKTSNYKVFSNCLGKPQWIGSLSLSTKEKDLEVWKLEVPIEAWTSYFGVGVSIFHPRLNCELTVSAQKRLLKMKCPIYARNRSPEEFVELNDFLFEKNGVPVMKIEGYVKQPPELVSKIESLVPIDGDIRIKETRYPKKEEVVEKIDFEHKKKGDPSGQKEKNSQKSFEKESNEKEDSEKESNEKENRQSEGEENNQEAPPIKPEAPPPSR